MAKATRPKMTPAEQLEGFKQAARELGTDDDPERFKERVKRVGSVKPKPPEAKPADPDL